MSESITTQPPTMPEPDEDETPPDVAAYLDALELVREPNRFEGPVIAGIRARDTAAGPDGADLERAAADRRLLLGLLDAKTYELTYALDGARGLEKRAERVESACDNLTVHAALLAKTDPAGAAGIQRALAIIRRAMTALPPVDPRPAAGW